MNNALIVRGIVDIVRDGFSTKFITQASYTRMLRACGVPEQKIESYLKPGLLDDENTSFSEHTLYETLIADEEFCSLFAELLHTPVSTFSEKIDDMVTGKIHQRRELISSIEISKDEHSWHILLNREKLLRIPVKGDNSYWGHIYKIASKEGRSEIQKVKSKGVTSWFNSNMENPIYKETLYKKTGILRYKSDFLYAEDGIVIKQLSQRRLGEKRRS